MTITEFLLARYDEDEAAARAAGSWLRADDAHDDDQLWCLADEANPKPFLSLRDVGFRFDHIARWDPARVLAECDAKRLIVERGHSECGGNADQAEFGSHHYPDLQWSHCDGCAAAESADQDWLWTLKVLSMPYADHPDYQQEWKP